MRKLIIIILCIAVNYHRCTLRKLNPVQLSSKLNEQSEKDEPNDSSLNDSLINKVMFNYGEIKKDSIFDDEGKALFIVETFHIKNTLVQFDGHSCYDIGLKVSCYRDTVLLFSKIIKKKDFYHLFEHNNETNLSSLIITSCSIQKITKNPCLLTLRTYIGQPYTDYGFDFIIQFDIEGNYTITPYADENN